MRPTLGEDWTTTGFEGRSTAAKKIKRVRKKEEEHNSKMKLKKKRNNRNKQHNNENKIMKSYIKQKTVNNKLFPEYNVVTQQG